MEDVLSILRAGAMQSEIRELTGGAPFLGVPKEYCIQSLEFLLNQPLSRRGHFRFDKPQDFKKFVVKFQQPNTMGFWHKRDDKKYVLTVIFDFHEAGALDDVEHSKAHKWQFQASIEDTRKVDIEKCIKSLPDSVLVFAAECLLGPYLTPVTPEKENPPPPTE